MARTKRKVNPLHPAPAAEAPKPRIYRAGGYARLSLEDSGNLGADTIEVQRVFLEDYISSQQDLQLYQLYCDNGWTGTNFDRPAFEQMMEDVRTGKIDCIVVKDLSRFGRNYLETGNYLERIFPLLDIRFIAVNDNFDTLTAERSSDGYIIPLKNIINAVYSKDISRKISSALRTKRQNGEFIGSWAPYGYQKCADDHHRLEPNAETAPVVRDIFRWRSEGKSYLQITRRLNDAGIPPPYKYLYLNGVRKDKRYKDVIWTHSVISKILRNEVYLGHLVQGRRREILSEGQKSKSLPKSEWIIVRNTHEPLIDEETFLAVQKIAEQTRQVYHKRLGKYDHLDKIPNIFQGLIFCANCGHLMSRRRNVRNCGAYQWYSYVCPIHATDLSACPNNHISEKRLKEMVWDILQREIALAGNMEQLMQQYEKSAKAVQMEDTANREMNAAKQMLDRAEMLYDSLYQNYVDQLMSEQEYVELKQKYRNDMEQAKARLAELEQQQQFRQHQTTGNSWLAACRSFRDEMELTEEMAHALIERVEIGPGKQMEVTLRYRDEYRTLAALLKAEGLVIPA